MITLRHLPWFVLVAIGAAAVYVLYKQSITVNPTITLGDPSIRYR